MKKKHYSLIAILIFIFILTNFTVFSGTRHYEIRDSLDRKVNLSSLPRKIVATSPRVTQIAFDLGLGEKIVGVTSVTSALSYVPSVKRKAETKTKIGDAYSGLSMEKLVDLRPDLVILDSLVFPEEVVGELSKMGISVYCAGGENLEEIMETLLELGQLTGSLTRAKEIVGDMILDKIILEDRVKKIEEKTETLYMLDDSIYTVGGTAYLDKLLSMAGLKNVFGDRHKKWIKVSKEAIVQADPELILVAYNPAVNSIKDLKSNPGLANTEAVKNGDVFFLSNELTSKLNQAGTKLMEGVLDLFYLVSEKEE